MVKLTIGNKSTKQLFDLKEHELKIKKVFLKQKHRQEVSKTKLKRWELLQVFIFQFVRFKVNYPTFIII